MARAINRPWVKAWAAEYPSNDEEIKWAGGDIQGMIGSLRSRKGDNHMSEETVTLLEMTSRDELTPARRPSASRELEEIGLAAAAVLRGIYVRIGAPLSWTGRMGWSDGDWEEELAHPGVRAWIARVNGNIAGLAELDSQQNGDVGIVVFGLVPEYIGKGLGGWFLSEVTQLAWTVMTPATRPTKRVWVQTSSDDHPHALPNYQRRGFRSYRVEHRPDGNDNANE